MNRKSKNIFLESLISRQNTAVEVFEVLSVVMTSSPEVVRTNNFFIDFGVFGPTELNSELCFRSSFTGLRFARHYRRPSHMTTSFDDELTKNLLRQCST